MSDKTKTRVYVVDITGQTPRLVRASHPLNALRFVSERLLSVRFAMQEELITMLGKGIQVEDVAEDPVDPRQGTLPAV